MRPVTHELASRRLPAVIFIAVFAFYWATTSREPAWGDARPMWEVAEGLVNHGKLSIATRWPEDIPLGTDGRVYGITPIGTALVHVPGAALAALFHAIASDHDPLVRPLAVHLAPSLLGATAAVLFFLLLVDLGIRRRTASACTAILVTASTLWVYAHYPYSEILQLTCFVGLFRATLRTADQPTRRNALWWGTWAGCALNAKYVLALAIVGGAAVIALAWYRERDRRREFVRALGWAAAAAAPWLVLAMVYNAIRWGSPLETGYGPYLGAFFGGSLFDGAWGMLASPNKSALLYSPPLILAVLAMPRAYRAVPRLGVATLVMCVPSWLVYCSYRSWSGDYAWGPRFFVWMVPVLMIPIAWWFDRERPARWRAALARWATRAIVGAGIAIQLLGIALYWDHFIRLAIDAKNQWLGQPNRRGAYIAERGRGHCDSCFEDTYEIMWAPPFHPIRGHWWLVQSIARGDSAAEAQQSAPWRTYTTLDVRLDQNYPRARIDWWGLIWLRDATHTALAGIVVLGVLLSVLGFAVWRWLIYHRCHEPESVTVTS